MDRLLGMYVNFIGDKCYIFPLNSITKKNGCKVVKVLCNKTTAIQSGKVDKWIIEIPKTLASMMKIDVSE